MALEDAMLECYVQALPPYQSIMLSTQPRLYIDTRVEATMMSGSDILKRRLLILDDELKNILEQFHEPLHCNLMRNSTSATSLQCPVAPHGWKVLYLALRLATARLLGIRLID